MGAVFGLFAGFYYWAPKIVGLTYNELLGKIHFWTLFAGVKYKNNSIKSGQKNINRSDFFFIKSKIRKLEVFRIKGQSEIINYDKNNRKNYSWLASKSGKSFSNSHTSRPQTQTQTFTQQIESRPSNNLVPWFVTGFSDAESTFSISCFKDKKLTLGWQIQPAFSIALHKKDLEILLQIQSFFNGVGRIKFENKNNKVGYVVTKISDLTNVIIPHFKEYTLMSQKRADFMLFLSIIELMNKKQHLNKEGFINILKLKYNLNLGLRDELKQILVSESTSAKKEPTFFFFS